MRKFLCTRRGIIGALFAAPAVALSLVFACDLQSGTGPAEGDTSHANPTNQPPLKLTVTIPKTEFALSDTVTLTFTLENVSSEAVWVCPIPHGVIHVQGFRINGELIKAEEGRVSELGLVIQDWRNAMTKLTAGSSVRFDKNLYPHPSSPNGPIVADTVIKPGTGVLTGAIETHAHRYRPTGAGFYSIRFFYKYEGPAWTDEAIYEGAIPASEVSFVVR